MTEVDLSTSLSDVMLLLMAIDSVMGDELNPKDALAQARKIYCSGRDAEHDGDCTNQPHSCLRCYVDHHEQEARKLIENEGLVPV